MTKDWINLTNGIEKLNEFDIQDVEFIRICSTTLERKDWLKLMGDLDHNFLFHLAIGTHCHVWDYGTNRPCSKSIYQGVEIIRYILDREWYGIIPDTMHQRCRNGKYKRNDSFLEYFGSIYDSIFTFDDNKDKTKVKRKLRYYKKFLMGNRVNLIGHSSSTSHDGDYKFYSELLCSELTAIPI